MTGRASKIRSGRRGWPRLSCGYEQWLFLTRSPPFCVVQRVHVDLLDPWTLNAVWISANPVLQCVGCQVGYGVFRIHCVWALKGAKRCVFLALRPWLRLCLHDVLHIPKPTGNRGDGYNVGMLSGEAVGSSKVFFVDFFFLCRIKCLPLHCRFLSWKGVGCEIREYSMRKKRYDRMMKPDQSFGKVVCNCLVLNLLCNLAGFIRISVS